MYGELKKLLTIRKKGFSDRIIRSLFNDFLLLNSLAIELATNHKRLLKPWSLNYMMTKWLLAPNWLRSPISDRNNQSRNGHKLVANICHLTIQVNKFSD